MHATRRVGRRSRLALVSGLSLVLVSAPTFTASASAAEEEEGTKNLSTPVVLVDDTSMSAAFSAPPTEGQLPFVAGNADYTKDGVDYYTGVSSEVYPSTVDQSFDADTWGAEYVEELANPVVADVKWGDNLLSHVFSGNQRQPVRVEVNLFADATTSAGYGDLLGYETVSLEGTEREELFGTEGEAVAIPPMVYTPNATLTILEYEAATNRYSKEIYDGTMTGEVNGSGKLIYGFNWGRASGLDNPGPGNYRLVFTVADESLVTFGTALGGEEGEAPTHIPMIASPKISYLDIAMGDAELLDPPLPFIVPGTGFEADFDNDGNADVIARDRDGVLWLYPGNGTNGWAGARVKLGTNWNIMTMFAS